MYVFDLLCGTLCVASVLLWARGRWILSFLAFWLAYKSKELAVMLPAVLVCYELWFGGRRWLRLAPFLAASLSFAVQALLLHPVEGGDYSFHFHARHYRSDGAFLCREDVSDTLFGVSAAPRRGHCAEPPHLVRAGHDGSISLPLLWLPGRMFSAYCYLPFAGLAIVMAGIAETARPAAIALFFLLWLPADIYWLNAQANQTLQQDRDAREWITTLGNFAKTRPAVTGFSLPGFPEAFHNWSAEGGVSTSFAC